MKAYLDLLSRILKQGKIKGDRTGTGTKSVFGHQIRFDLNQGFPLVTTKRIHFHSVVHELLWMVKGDTNVKYLQENGVRIWNQWADSDGNLGPVYGAMWRRWPTPNGRYIDQLEEAQHKIRNKPDDRRIIVNSWNVGLLDEMRLPPCHLMFQFDVTDNKLSCGMTIRSWDVFLGGPFNIAFYALLTMMLAQTCDRELGDLVISSGDTHLYSNHFDQANEQLTRTPYELPGIVLNPEVKSIFDFRYEDIELVNYVSHPPIKAEVAV